MNQLKEVRVKTIKDGKDGIIYVVESKREIPFEIKRVYFIDDLDFGSMRGFHAHKKLMQIIFCLRGSFELEMYDGYQRTSHKLSEGSAAFIPPMIWHSMKNFIRRPLIAVLASDYFDERDYIRKFTDFKKAVK